MRHRRWLNNSTQLIMIDVLEAQIGCVLGNKRNRGVSVWWWGTPKLAVLISSSFKKWLRRRPIRWILVPYFARTQCLRNENHCYNLQNMIEYGENRRVRRVRRSWVCSFQWWETGQRLRRFGSSERRRGRNSVQTCHENSRNKPFLMLVTTGMVFGMVDVQIRRRISCWVVFASKYLLLRSCDWRGTHQNR